MSNMRYCRFRNTVSDFYDCLMAIEEGHELSEEELEAAEAMREAALEFVRVYDDQPPRPRVDANA